MINIQAEVEKPFLYIMARCPSNKQQFLYAEERIKDILNLKEDLALLSGIKIHDVFRFFKGDAPAHQFEAGHQKGGNYVCVQFIAIWSMIWCIHIHSKICPCKIESTKSNCQLKAVINVRRTAQSYMKI